MKRKHENDDLWKNEFNFKKRKIDYWAAFTQNDLFTSNQPVFKKFNRKRKRYIFEENIDYCHDIQGTQEFKRLKLRTFSTKNDVSCQLKEYHRQKQHEFEKILYLQILETNKNLKSKGKFYQNVNSFLKFLSQERIRNQSVKIKNFLTFVIKNKT